MFLSGIQWILEGGFPIKALGNDRVHINVHDELHKNNGKNNGLYKAGC